MKHLFALILISCLLGGCAGLMRAERERALDEAFEKGKIDKVQYLTKKSLLERERK